MLLYPFHFTLGETVLIGPLGKPHDGKRGTIHALELSEHKTTAVIRVPNHTDVALLRFPESYLTRSS